MNGADYQQRSSIFGSVLNSRATGQTSFASLANKSPSSYNNRGQVSAATPSPDTMVTTRLSPSKTQQQLPLQRDNNNNENDDASASLLDGQQMPPLTGTITLDQNKCDLLVKKSSVATQLDRNLKSAKTELDKLSKKHNKLVENYNKLHETAERKDLVIAELKQQTAEMTQLLRKNGKVHESELNNDLVEHVVEAAKTNLFRTWKFIEEEADSLDATQEVIAVLPRGKDDILGMDENDFVTKYKDKVNLGLKRARQYVQSEGKKRSDGKNYFRFCLSLYHVCNLFCC